MAGQASRVALVTGAGSGIGRCSALALAAAGAAVMVSDINVEAGEETVQMICDGGGEAAFVRANVAVRADVDAMVAATVERFGRLDWAVNNAGIEGVLSTVVDYPDEVFDRVMAINVKGVWMCMQYEIPAMLANGGGAIVNMASVAGLGGNPHATAYTASKHAVIGLTKSAALGYATQNIRVNAVCPGNTETPMIERLSGEIYSKEMFASRQPIGRLGRPEEIAEAVVWLCSDKASLVTGIAMPVDGGLKA